MKKLLPYLYLMVIYGIIAILLAFEVDPGPFLSLGLILAAGMANIVWSFRLYRQDDVGTLKHNAVVLVVFLSPICLMIAYFLFIIGLISTASVNNSLAYVLPLTFLMWFILLLPASFYLLQYLRKTESPLIQKILAFIPILQLIPLIAR